MFCSSVIWQKILCKKTYSRTPLIGKLVGKLTCLSALPDRQTASCSALTYGVPDVADVVDLRVGGPRREDLAEVDEGDLVVHEGRAPQGQHVVGEPPL